MGTLSFLHAMQWQDHFGYALLHDRVLHQQVKYYADTYTDEAAPLVSSGFIWKYGSLYSAFFVTLLLEKKQ